VFAQGFVQRAIAGPQVIRQQANMTVRRKQLETEDTTEIGHVLQKRHLLRVDGTAPGYALETRQAPGYHLGPIEGQFLGLAGDMALGRALDQHEGRADRNSRKDCHGDQQT